MILCLAKVVEVRKNCYFCKNNIDIVFNEVLQTTLREAYVYDILDYKSESDITCRIADNRLSFQITTA